MNMNDAENHAFEQHTGAVRNAAMIVAAFYNGLVSYGVPDITAGILAGDYLRHLLEQSSNASTTKEAG